MAVWRRILMLLMIGVTLGGELYQVAHHCGVCLSHSSFVAGDSWNSKTEELSSGCCGDYRCCSTDVPLGVGPWGSEGGDSQPVVPHDQEDCVACQAYLMAKSLGKVVYVDSVVFTAGCFSCPLPVESFVVRCPGEADLVRGPPEAGFLSSAC